MEEKGFNLCLPPNQKELSEVQKELGVNRSW